ncbi:hypothetical protein CTAYLR_005239 [Chrysophaeum taylorii]|uniref:DNA-directed RNA polymerase III subunit RPC8 n=1 Tax=Chrysophaeum taylorii TaxID=2483200 RepID=A0AAD7UC40_9STRA|nr:hypothetical protein CTAYLR_005239 [Chrysophaeum taylorii]
MCFVLATISDSVRVAPHHFARAVEEVLREEIDAKYAGRVVSDVGLCLGAVSIQRSEGLVFPLEGCATYDTTFQQLVFRPFMGEIIVGTIVGSNSSGLVASLEFFEDVTIPRKFLPKPSTYDEAARLWSWKYDDATELHLDIGLEMRIRVKSVNFTRVTAHKRGLQATTTVTEATSNDTPTTPGGYSRVDKFERAVGHASRRPRPWLQHCHVPLIRAAVKLGLQAFIQICAERSADDPAKIAFIP